MVEQETSLRYSHLYLVVQLNLSCRVVSITTFFTTG